MSSDSCSGLDHAGALLEAPFIVAYRLRLCVDAATAVGWAGPRQGARRRRKAYARRQLQSRKLLTISSVSV